MVKFSVGTYLLDVIDSLNEININEHNKNCILNFCREELAHGDSTISNEFELAMIESWFDNQNTIKMPLISDKYHLEDTFTVGNKVFEEYKSSNNTYFVRCVTFDSEGKVSRVQLSCCSTSLSDIYKNGGVEDIFVDTNNDGNINIRNVHKTIVKQDGGVESKMFSDFDLDGDFD